MVEPRELSGLRIIYVTPDCTDSAVKKRAQGFVSLGTDLLSFSFRRTRYDAGYIPDWPNVELGRTTELRIAARILTYLNALRIIFVHRDRWRAADLLYVRNLDLALLALAGKAMTGSRARLFYEVLDVHPGLTRPGARGRVLRWLERRVLNRCELLVVSSSAFLSQYFRPQQAYSGPAFLLENKWLRESFQACARRLPYELADGEPVWTIGWFGNIRCQKSLDILVELAAALPDRVRICIRGCASLLGEQVLENAIRGRSNMIFAGEYRAPHDFPTIYSQVHFNWCADLADVDNSLWLLPNRLYEGGYFGIPAIALASQESGRIVHERQLGFALESPVVEELKKLLLGMTSEQYRQLRAAIEAQPSDRFVDEGEIAQLLDPLRSDITTSTETAAVQPLSLSTQETSSQVSSK